MTNNLWAKYHIICENAQSENRTSSRSAHNKIKIFKQTNVIQEKKMKFFCLKIALYCYNLRWYIAKIFEHLLNACVYRPWIFQVFQLISLKPFNKSWRTYKRMEKTIPCIFEHFLHLVAAPRGGRVKRE